MEPMSSVNHQSQDRDLAKILMTSPSSTQGKVRWEVINPMVRTAFGELRMRHNPVLGKEKTEVGRLTGAYKFLAGEKFTVENVDVWLDEALGGRLQKGTNHKRAFTTSHILPLQKLQLYFNEDSHQRETSSRKRYSTEDPEDERCTQERRRLCSEHNPHRAVDYACTMSGNSPGKRKRRSHHSSIPTSPVELSSEPVSPPTVTRNIGDSAEPDENEGKVVSAKRVKPNAGKKLKQHSSEVVNADPVDSSFNGDAREYTGSQASKDVLQEQTSSWGFAARYKNALSSALVDFGHHNQPGTPAPLVEKEKPQRRGPMPSYLGGPKPVNRLGNKSSNNSVSATRQPNHPAAKTFDLTGPSGQEYNPNKRQRIERTPMSSNASPNQAIDLEPDPRYNYNSRRPSTARSGQSQSYSGHQIIGSVRDDPGRVGEFLKVERTVNIKQSRKQRRESSSDGNGAKRNRPSVVRLDETNDRELSIDPIQSDSEPHATVPKHVQTPRTTLQIQIPSQRQSASSYQGNSYLKPPRNQPNGRHREFTAAAVQGPTVSQHFSQANSEMQRRNSRGSISGDEMANIHNAQQATRQQARSSAKKSNKNPPSSVRYEDDGAVDEISAEHYRREEQMEYELAQKLLAKPKHNHRLDSKRGSAQHQIFQVAVSSDEEDTRRKGDIPQTNFSTSKKTKAKQNPNEERYDISQVLIKGHTWLHEGNNNIWSLRLNCQENTLSIHNEHGSAVSDLILAPRSIHKILRGRDNSKVVVFKAADQSVRGASMLHLEFLDRDQSEGFVEKVKSFSPNIGVIGKEGGHLDKIFENSHKQPDSRTRRSSVNQEPDDIKLAKKRQADRWAKEEESKKPTEQRVIDRLQSSKDDTRSGTRGRTSAKRTRSNSDPFDEETERDFRYPQMEVDDFYGNSDKTRSNATSYYGTRSAAKDREPAARQPIQPRSPSPERWTTTNPKWAKDWQSSIVYPREGKDRATVDKQDIERLDEGEFLNDNLIIFYLRWLEDRLSKENPALAKRVYFQNTFFYARLTKTAKGKRGINYQAVERWTAKVDLLSFDYIIVPVNENTHWYVAIICNAPKLVNPDIPEVGISQSQETVDKFEDQQVEPSSITKSSLLPPVVPSSPNPNLDNISDPVVNTKMEGMSLEDRQPGVSEESEWPEPDLLPHSSKHEGTKNDTPFVGYDGSNEGVAEDDLEIVTSDLHPKKLVQTKKGKRKSIPAPRKYNPKEPRIITFDSLGLSHSPTCTNLKEYLIAEAKAKKGEDIPPPGSLGMTAKHIPQQTNYCDCGLFLLSYIEMFLEKGDDFIHGLLQNSMDLELEWRKASEMRSHIRGLLFDLQREQVAENERLRKEKGKGKRTPKAEREPEVTVPNKYESREASKSARASPERLTDEVLDPPQKPSNHSREELAIESSARLSKKTKSAEPPAVPPSMQPAKSSLGPLKTVVDLDDDSQEIPESQDDRTTKPKGIVASFYGSISQMLGKSITSHGNRETQANAPQAGVMIANALDISESSVKLSHDDHHQQQGGPLQSQISEVQESPEQSNHLHRPHVEDDMSRPIGVKIVRYPQLQDCDHSYRKQASTPRDLTRDSESPRFESQDPFLSIKNRKGTPHPAHHSSPSPELGQRSGSNAIVILDPDEDSVHIIPTEHANKKLENKSHPRPDDVEMLLSNGSQEPLGDGENDDPEFLTDSTPISPMTASTFNPLQGGQQSLAASPISPRRAKRRTTPSTTERRDFDNKLHHTAPLSGMKRKYMADTEDRSSLGSRKSSNSFRDPSDKGIIGNHKHAKGKHIKFES